MMALTSDAHLEPFSNVVHHSRYHIEWNLEEFLTDILLQFFNSSWHTKLLFYDYGEVVSVLFEGFQQPGNEQFDCAHNTVGRHNIKNRKQQSFHLPQSAGLNS